MTNETDDDGAGDDGLEICRETYGGDVAVRVACRTSFRGTLLDGGLDRTGLMQWPARVAVSEWLCAARSTLKGKRLVELGCGAGGCGAVAAALGLDVLATDASPEALALAARNLAANAAPGARYDVARHVWGDGWSALGPRDVAYAADVVYPATPPAAVDALFASARAAVGASGVFVLGFVVRGARLPERLFAAAAAAGCGARVLDGGAAAAPCGATVFEFAFAGGGDLEACARRAYPGIWAPERDDGDAPSSDDEWMPFAGEAAADALW